MVEVVVQKKKIHCPVVNQKIVFEQEVFEQYDDVGLVRQTKGRSACRNGDKCIENQIKCVHACVPDGVDPLR